MNQTLEKKFVEYEQLLQEQVELDVKAQLIEEKKSKLQVALKAQNVIPYEEQRNARKKEWQEQQEKERIQQEKVTTITKNHETMQHKHQEESEKQADQEKLQRESKQAKQHMEQINHYNT